MNTENYSHFEKIAESLIKVSKFILLIYGDNKLDTKNQVLRNFTAKTNSLLTSIKLLLFHHQVGESIALYRMLIERYLYLEYLEKEDNYQEFSDWSYIKTYESRNNVRSNTDFNDPEIDKELTDNIEHTKEYQRLKNKKIEWRKPNLEKLAKELKISELYGLGYNFGSSYVHPRADEGYWDALRIVGKNNPNDLRRKNVLKNSILLTNGILITTSINSSIDFGKYLNLYCNSIFRNINEGKELPNLKDIETLFFGFMISKIEK